MTFPIHIPPAGEAENGPVLRQFRIVNDHLGSFTPSTATGTISNAITVVNSASATTQTLPSASGSSGRVFTIKNRGAGLLTLSPLSGETIDGKTAAHIYKNGCVSLTSDGSNWIVLSILSAAYA